MSNPNAVVPAAKSKFDTLHDALKKATPSMKAVASSVITPERLIKIALNCAAKTPALLDCDAKTIARAVMNAAELGLSFGALNHAYLVPYNREAQLIVSAQGLCDLAYRSGLVESITAEVVYKQDTFEFELGLTPKLRHVPSGESIDPKDITFAYMVVRIKGGSVVFRVMTKAEIDRVRAGSRAGNTGPWVNHYAEMARKTVIKNGMKYVPKNVEMARAIAYDNAVESGDPSLIELEYDDAEFTDATGVTGTTDLVAAKIAEKTAGTLPEGEDPYTGPTVKEGK